MERVAGFLMTCIDTYQIGIPNWQYLIKTSCPHQDHDPSLTKRGREMAGIPVSKTASVGVAYFFYNISTKASGIISNKFLQSSALTGLSAVSGRIDSTTLAIYATQPLHSHQPSPPPSPIDISLMWPSLANKVDAFPSSLRGCPPAISAANPYITQEKL